ncbi:MAG: twin-arginine translocase subunit TatB [Clostridia bacterium]|nr:twin-arginine translocase subunit TatB [Clostridia bacterium]
MFNIGFAELLLVLVIAYVIVGPKDLPKVARWLGRLVRQAKQLIRELKEEVGWNEMMAETEDVRREIDSAMKDADVSKEMKDARKTLQNNLREAEKDTMKK